MMEKETMNHYGVEVSIMLNTDGTINLTMIDDRYSKLHEYGIVVEYDDNLIPHIWVSANTAIINIVRAIKAYISPYHGEK